MANQVVTPPSDGKSSDPFTSITTLNRKVFTDSKWKDASYKRRAIASLIQAVYSLEIDRQENRTQENSLAPDFWIPFKYKPTQVLIDERDGSIFGAIFEWDRSASFTEFKPFKPIGAPRAVLALRGTLIRIPTMRRDFEDDFRFVALESLKDSVRFKVTMDAIKSVSETHGSRNVCIAGHSLGAGFGLQVGKELAKERMNVETHLFNPPSVSLAMSLGNIGEKAEYVWNRIKPMLPLPSSSETQVSNDVDETYTLQSKRMITQLMRLMDAGFGKGKWVPHLYVNNNDGISHFYIYTDRTREKIVDMENTDPINEQSGAKLFVVLNEGQKFLEAHGMKQWWSSEVNVELKHDIRNSELVSTQLKSLNTITPSQIILFYYPQYISLATSRIHIREATDYVWNILKCVPHISGKAQISNDGEGTSGIGLMDWISRFSGLKETDYRVCKWVSGLYVNKNGGIEEKMVKKENMDSEDSKITAKLSVPGLEQWWPSDTELHQAIHDSKQLISRKIRSLYTVTPWEVTKKYNPFISLPICLNNIGQKEEFVEKLNSIKSILLSSSDIRVKNDNDKKISSVLLPSSMPSLSSFKDGCFALVKRASPMFNLPFVSPAMSHGNNGEKEKFVSSNETQASNNSNKTSSVGLKNWKLQLSGVKDAALGVGKFAPYLYPNKGTGGLGDEGSFPI